MLKRHIVGAFALLICFSFSPLSAETQSYTPVNRDLILLDGQHLLSARTPDGSVIELEEGSQFEVIKADCDIANEWESQDLLTISANTTPKRFRSGDYYITNSNKDGSYVRADYKEHPVVDHPYTLTIYHIDHHYGEIYMIDGRGYKSCWQVNPKDIHLIRNWGFQIDPQTRKKIWDTVIIGKNEGCLSNWFSNDEFILISYENTNYVQYVRASKKQL